MNIQTRVCWVMGNMDTPGEILSKILLGFWWYRHSGHTDIHLMEIFVPTQIKDQATTGNTNFYNYN